MWDGKYELWHNLMGKIHNIEVNGLKKNYFIKVYLYNFHLIAVLSMFLSRELILYTLVLLYLFF